MKHRRSIYLFLILPIFCQCSIAEIRTPSVEEGSYLKSIRKFVLSFPNKIEVEMKKATMRDSMESPPVLTEASKDGLEKSYSKSFTTAFTEYASSRIEAVPADRISFVEESETDKDRARILETLGVNARIEVKSKVTLDYPTRVPDLGVGNIFYFPLLLDLWWIDLSGAWRIDHTLEFSVVDIKTGSVKFQSTPVTKGKSTRTFILSNLNSSEFNEAIEKSTEEIILAALGKK